MEPDREDFDSAVSRIAVGVLESVVGDATAGEGDSDASLILWKRPGVIAGDLLEGTVLLRAIFAPAVPSGKVVLPDGVPGLDTPGLPRSLEPRDETETLRLTAPNFRRLSAPALALDADRPSAFGDLRDAGPLSTSF